MEIVWGGGRIIVWRDGRIFSYWIEDRKLRRREHIYVHIQKRNLKVKNSPVASNFIIIPNKIISLSEISNRKICKAILLAWYKRILHLEEINHFIREQCLFWRYQFGKVVKAIKRECDV